MKLSVIALVAGCLLATPAMAQFDMGHTVPEFIALCKSGEPVDKAQCRGYFTGILDFQRLAMQRMGAKGAMFCPSVIVIPTRTIPDYLAWVEAHPAATYGVPSVSVLQYFIEKNPCPTPTPSHVLVPPASSPADDNIPHDHDPSDAHDNQ